MNHLARYPNFFDTLRPCKCEDCGKNTFRIRRAF